MKKLLAFLFILAFLFSCSQPMPTISLPKYIDGMPITYKYANLERQMADAIFIRPNNLTLLSYKILEYPEVKQHFIIFHEYCHGIGYESEVEADCCSIDLMTRIGLFTDKEFAKLIEIYTIDDPQVERVLTWENCSLDF